MLSGNFSVQNITGKNFPWRCLVDAVATSNYTPSNLVNQVITGITVTTTTRVLLTAQSDPVQNGVYLNNSRAPDMVTGSNARGTVFYNVNLNHFYCCVIGDIVDTDALVFRIFTLNISELNSVNITSPATNQGLVYNSGTGNWVNSNIANSFNSRTGAVTPQKSDYNLNLLTDVTITSAATNQILRYNGTNWVNTTDVISFNTRTGAVTPQKSDYNLNLMADVTITSAAAGQHLVYNGTNWLNTTVSLVNTFNGRSGTVISQKSDYNLNLLTDVTITSAATNQVLRYNGSTWVNTTDVISFNTRTGAVTPQKSDYSLNLLADVTLTSVATGQYLVYNGTNWVNSTVTEVNTFNGRSGTVVPQTNDYNITQLAGVAITTPATNQVLRYNGTNWVNATDIISFNTRTGAVTPQKSDYSLNLLADVTLTSVATGQYLVYNGTNWVNNTVSLVNSFNTRTGAVTPQKSDYNLNLLGDVTLTSVATGQYLVYNGTNWVNNSVSLVNSFNGRTGTVTPATNDYNIIQLAGVTITTPNTNQILRYNGSTWVNTTDVISFNSRTGVVTPSANDYNITQLAGVTITTPNTNQILRYNGTNWVNTTDVVSFNSRTGAVVPATNDYNITQLAGVAITSPLNNQVLRYNGTAWVNTTDVVSFNSRTGAVVPAANDYSLAQLATVSISSPVSGQYLSYNGTNWVNVINPFYKLYYSNISETVTAAANTYYVLNSGGTITIDPLNVGEHIMVTANANIININFTGASIVINNSSFVNPAFELLYSTIEIICVSSSVQTIYELIRVSQNRDNSVCKLNSVKIAAINNISDIPNVNITSVQDNQVLRYSTSSAAWVNATDIISFNTRTGAVTPQKSDYSLNLLADVTLTLVATGQYLIYNGTNWVNSTITQVNSFNGRSGTVTPQKSDYNLNLLGDVTITSVATGQYLVYNGTNWVNNTVSLVNSFNGRIGTVVPVANDYNITQLAGVTITTPATNQILRYNGTNWINTTDVVSFNSRVGAVVPAANDYNITQLAGVVIASPALNQILRYNGTNWVNTTDVISFNGRTGTVVPTTNDYNITQLAGVTITTPTTNQILRYNGTNWINTTDVVSFNSRVGAVVPAANDYNITQLAGVTISSPTSGQYLIYNGTNWANTSVTVVNSFNGRSGVINPTTGDYNITQLTGVAITSPASGQYLTYNGTNWANTSVTLVNTFNGRSGTVVPATNDYTLTQIGGVTITTPLADQTLRYNGTVWVNANDVVSFNGRVGVVTPATNDYTLTQIGGVTITTPATDQILRYNGSAWVNANNIISFNGRTGAVSPAANDYNLTQLAGVAISSPTSGQLFSYNGTNWVNTSVTLVNTFNGRSGTVVPATNDYNITQLAGVVITTPAANQILRYNSISGNWINTTDVISFNGRVGAVVPATNDYNLTQLAGVTISSPTSGQYLTYNGTNWVNTSVTLVNTFNGRSGTVVPATNDYNITQLAGVTITTPAANQVLRYNGTNWANSTDVVSFNGRIGVVTPATNDYNITQLAGVAISSPVVNQLFGYNGTNWINPTGILFNNTTKTFTLSGSSSNVVVTQDWINGVGTWINLSTDGASGIGTGGPGVNPWLGYSQVNNQWFTNSTAGDLCYRNTSGRLLFGTSTGNLQLALATTGFTIATPLVVSSSIADNSNSVGTSGQVLSSTVTGVAWVTRVASVFGRTGTVVAANGDYNITQLAGVTITTPVTDQILRYNGTNWVNTTDVVSFNGRIGAVTPATNDYTLTQISGISISSPLTNQILRYNGTNWANSTDVASFNSRTGAVVPTSGDYNLTQLAGVAITSPVSNQVLAYNGTNWVNNSVNSYYNSVYVSTNTVISPAVASTHYTFAAGGIIRIPMTFAVGDKLMVTSLSVNTLIGLVSGGNIVYINSNEIAFAGINIVYGTIELTCVQKGSFDLFVITRVSQNHISSSIAFSTFAKISAVSKLNDIPDILVDSAVNGSLLEYNNGIWGPSSVTFVNKFNNRSGNVVPAEGDYSLTQLSDVTITSPITGDLLRYNGTTWVNFSFNLVNSFNGRVGTVVPAANDYNITQLAGVSITSAVANQILSYNGTNWSNTNSNIVANRIIYGTASSALTTSSNLTFDGTILTVNSANTSIPATGGVVANFRGPVTILNGLNDDTRFISALDTNMVVNGIRYISFGQSATALNQAELIFTYAGSGNILNSFNLGLYGTVYIAMGNNRIGLNRTLVPTTITDSTASVGTAGQILSSTGSAVTWTTNNLNNLSDVVINSAALNQTLVYDDTNWVNKRLFTFPVHIFNPGSITVALDTNYVTGTAGATFTIPTCNTGDSGRRIMITSSQGVTTNVTFPNNIFLVYSGTYTNFTMNTNQNASMELIVLAQNQYTFSSVTGLWGSTAAPFSKTFNSIMANVGDLRDTLVSSPAAAQMLQYNGSQWINTPWFLDINTGTSVVNQVLRYDGTEWVNSPPVSMQSIYFNSGGNLAISGTNFIGMSRVSTTITLCNMVISRPMTATRLTVQRVTGSSVGAGYRFTLFKNGATTGNFVDVTGTTLTNSGTFSVSFAQFDTLAISYTNIGVTVATAANVTLDVISSTF